MKRVELVAPAGDRGSLVSAVSAGADAVYFGVKGLNMRRSAGNFDVLEIAKVMSLLHSSSKKGYLALNTMVYDGELDKARKILDSAAAAKVDAVILWDMAVLGLVRERGMVPHLSTQASVSNFEALKAYHFLGVKRAVLARECSLEDVGRISGKISENKMDITLETFVHGAMCVSVSGRCFLSQHTFSRSANRGDCLQPCRREYRVIDTENHGECEYVLGEDYVMSAKDLCSLRFVDELIRSGINAFKIEGRMRSPEYVSVVTSVYRRAIDAYYKGEFNENLIQCLMEKLSGTFNRGFTEGFFFGTPEDTGASPKRKYDKIYVGEVLKFYGKIGVAEIMVRTRGINIGDSLLVTGDKTPAGFFDVCEMQVEHSMVDSIASGSRVGVKVPFKVRRGDKVFVWEIISKQ
ncbi:MAG: peptidase U32 family protein [Candidatus Omnitrophota bacterium]